jgi:hypothetical protein
MGNGKNEGSSVRCVDDHPFDSSTTVISNHSFGRILPHHSSHNLFHRIQIVVQRKKVRCLYRIHISTSVLTVILLDR